MSQAAILVRMGAVFRVEPGPEPDPAHDELAADYGWAHLHAFLDLVAAEENINIRTINGHGGSAPWDDVDTPLSPLLDPGQLPGGRLPASACVAMSVRISQIIDAWSQETYAGAAEQQMKRDQLVTLRKLQAVVEACVATGRALTLR